MAARHLAAALIPLLAAAGCASSTLEPWHTARLSEDFRAGDDVGTFEEYLAIEQRAFEELDDEVYAKVGTGPENLLVRFSRGSASDPETFPQNYNRSYVLDVESPRGGVLMLHGMSDSPYSLRALAESLNEAGFHVVALRLPGHGTAPAALTRTRWQDFAAAVELAMAYLADAVGSRPIHLVGFSNGGTVALNYALDALEAPDRPQAASLVLIAPAIGITPAAALAGPKDWLGSIPGLGRFRYSSMGPEFDPFRYRSFPTNAAKQTHRLTGRVANGVAGVERAGRGAMMPPILVIKSAVDSTVSNDAVIDRLLGRLPDNGNEFILFDVNRRAVTSSLIVDDPGPFARRLIDSSSLPFAVTLISNESTESDRVVARRKPALAAEFSHQALLEETWPADVVSLSHIALPFPVDDPLYGRYRPDDGNRLYMGSVSLRGERGILRIPDNWFTRQRYNPFYDYMEKRILEWCGG